MSVSEKDIYIFVIYIYITDDRECERESRRIGQTERESGMNEWGKKERERERSSNSARKREGENRYTRTVLVGGKG